MPLTNREHYPALVIGTGIAGLTTAFVLASAGIRVLLVTKASDPKDCNTFWAQGGIIYQGENDTAEKLIDDIMRAGAGISNKEAVRFLAMEGPRVVKELLLDQINVPFSTTDEGELDLTQEGAHSVSRIIHAGDATGRAIEVSLLNRVKTEPNITIATEVTAIDLLTTHHHPTDIQVRYRLANECVGAYARHWWNRPGVSAYDKHAARHRRWRRHGAPRRGAHHERRVCAVPPHRPR
jgi:L-aspartate oxidase